MPAPTSSAEAEGRDRDFGRPAVRVQPGEHYVTRRDELIVTVLGSCVSVCLRDAGRGVGGLNHFLLAESVEEGPAGASARYGGYAMELLINDLLKLGARRERLEAKVFGGGRVLSALNGRAIGERNAAFALDYLKAEGIAVLAHDVLGELARKIAFLPSSGRVWVRRLGRGAGGEVFGAERRWAAARPPQADGGVELFK